MIRLENLCKTFWQRGRPVVVADNLSATFPDRAVIGLLGLNGAGKSALMAMIAGTLRPDSGTIRCRGTVSWPVGLRGRFHRDLTGAQNTRFVARVHGVDSDALCDFVAGFTGLGASFHAPFRSYSAGMRARLSFGVSMGVPFDTYLVDEVTSVGDALFRARSRQLFRQRMQTSGAVVVSHSMGKLRQLCTMGAVLHEGRLHLHDDIEAAIAHHLDNVARAPGAAAALADEGWA